MKPPIKCIIFDCDGVLVDSEAISISTIVQLANNLGIEIDFEYGVRAFMGNSWEKVQDILENLAKKPLPHNFERTYRQTTYKRFRNELQAIKNIPRLIPQLTIPFCVASSGPVPKIQLNLKLTHLLPYFESHIFSCYDLQKWKPDPAIYIHAAQTMGFDPANCLVVEDSLLGVQAGVASGCQVYAYAASAHNKEALAAAGATLFYDMMDLKKLI